MSFNWLTSHVLSQRFGKYFGEYKRTLFSFSCNHNKQPHTVNADFAYFFYSIRAVYRFCFKKKKLSFCTLIKSHLFNLCYHVVNAIILMPIVLALYIHWFDRKQSSKTRMKLSFTSIYGNNSLLMVSLVWIAKCKLLKKNNHHTPPNANIDVLSCVHNMLACMCGESVCCLAHSNHCYWIIEL